MVMKEKELNKQILHLLLQQKEYMTSEKLAEALGVSRKTVNNYMPMVHQEAVKYGLELIGKKGRGFLLNGEENYRRALAAQLRMDMEQPAFQKERLLYLLHLLLNEGDLIRISELQDILHLSRPSIYKICDAADSWLSTYQLHVCKSRTRGLRVSEGEKRHRLAIVQWMSECERFLAQQNGNQGFLDTLKLQKCLQYYDKTDWSAAMDTLMNELQEQLSVTFLNTDTVFFKRSLEIILVRYQEGYTIQLPEKRIHLIQLIDQHHLIAFLQEYCLCEFHIRLPESEAMYFLSLLIVSDSCQEHLELNSLCITEQVDDQILQQLYSYLQEHLALHDEHIDQFFTQLIHIMQRELVYQIHEKQQAGHDYYVEFTSHFKVLSIFAKEMADLIIEHYDICYYDKFVYHLTILLAGIVEKEKRPLRCILLHDCNTIELEYLQIQLQSYLLSAQIIDTEVIRQMDNCTWSRYDLVLSSVPLPALTELPVLVIPKCMNYHDIVYCNKQIHEYFQKLNFHRLVKDSRMQFPQL